MPRSFTSDNFGVTVVLIAAATSAAKSVNCCWESDVIVVSPKEEDVDGKEDCGCLGVDGGLYVGRGGLVRHTATSLCASSFHDTQALFVSDHQAFFH